jgi:hypothetical protein
MARNGLNLEWPRLFFCIEGPFYATLRTTSQEQYRPEQQYQIPSKGIPKPIVSTVPYRYSADNKNGTIVASQHHEV